MLVDSLAPRDVFEVEVATRLAGVLIKLERLDRWSAATIAGAARMTAQDYEAGARSSYRFRVVAGVASDVLACLNGSREAEPTDWETFALFIRANAPGSPARLVDLWDEEHTPSSEKEWRTAFRSLVAHYWPEPTDAVEWAETISRKLWRRFEEVDGLEEQIAANRILNGPFDRQIKYESRLLNNLRTIRKEYSELQRRPLETIARKNEPNEEVGVLDEDVPESEDPRSTPDDHRER